MSKTISGTTTQFLYDGLNPVQELNGSNGVVANLLTGLRVDEYFTRTDTATSTFLTDGLGSTIDLVTANNGPIATNYTYQPFGAATFGGSASGNSYQFTGRENDGTGLYFYRARYYSPTFQRFVAQDPIGFGGGDPNLYGYVFQDPISLVDPFGLRSLTDCEKSILSPYIPRVDLNNADLHDDGVPWYLPRDKIGITRGNDIYFRPGGLRSGYPRRAGATWTRARSRWAVPGRDELA